MPLIDRMLAAGALGGIGSALAWRAVRAWMDYRLQRRTLALLVRSVTELEKEDGPPARGERRPHRA